nr:Chain C, substrate peptide (pep1) [Staphylococcus aureus]
DHDAHA